MREIRMLRSMWRGLETESRLGLHGHERGNSGYRQDHGLTDHRASPRPYQVCRCRGCVSRVFVEAQRVPERVAPPSNTPLSHWPFPAKLAFVCLSSTMFGLASPPEGWTPLIWLGFVPFFLVLEDASLSRRQAGWAGFAAGIAIGLVGFPWIARMLVNFTGVPWPVALLGLVALSAWMAVPFGLLGIAVWHLARSNAPSWQRWLLPPVIFAALQFLWPALFPYTPAIGFAEAPQWMQLAELGGIHLVEAQIVIAGRLAAQALRAGSAGVRLRCALLALAVPLASGALGAWRMAAIDAELAASRTVKLGLVQPNTPIGFWERTESMARLRVPSQITEAQGAQLVVWPEAGSYPYGVLRPFRKDSTSTDRQVFLRHRIPTLLGAASNERGERFGYNSFYSMGADGVVHDRYDKVIRVPFGEYIPLVDPELLNQIAPTVDHRYAGEGPRRWSVDLPGTPVPLLIGPMICYEDILPGYSRDVARLEGGIELFVNATIDAWYGYEKEPWEHLALAQFRSVEHRIPLVRAVSTGVSAYVDATGRLAAHLPSRPVGLLNMRAFPAEQLVVEIPIARDTASRPTVYGSFGWLYPWLCAAASLGFAFDAWRSRSRAG